MMGTRSNNINQEHEYLGGNYPCGKNHKAHKFVLINRLGEQGITWHRKSLLEKRVEHKRIIKIMTNRLHL